MSAKNLLRAEADSIRTLALGCLIEDNLNTSAALHDRKLDPLGTKIDAEHILRH